MYLYNWTILAPLININYCIESTASLDKTKYLIGSEYLPAYPSNCQIYGVDRTCYRCSPGFYKTNANFGSGYGTGVDQCIAKDTTTGGCSSSYTGSFSLLPFSIKAVATNYVAIDKFETCTGKIIPGNTTNYDLVQA